MKIKKGDTVKVLSGKDRGKQGIVKFTLPKVSKVVVEGVNIVKRHKKSQTTQEQKKRTIQEFEAPIPVAKVMLIEPKTGKTTRVGYKVEKGKKVRISKKTNKEIS